MVGLTGGEEWSGVCIPGPPLHCHTAWVYTARYAERTHISFIFIKDLLAIVDSNLINQIINTHLYP